MNAMLLAAGRGQRMQHLTDNKPKPLLTVAGKELIDWQIESLVRAEIEKIVINLGYLGDMIKNHCGNGARYNTVNRKNKTEIVYSPEPDPTFETGGGVFNALNLLGDTPFILASSDILTDFNYDRCLDINPEFAHIFLIDNPEYNLRGDFSLHENNAIIGNQYTYSNISVISPKLFRYQKKGRYPLGDIFRSYIEMGKITAEYINPFWMNIGTPDQLAKANELLLNKTDFKMI